LVKIGEYEVREGLYYHKEHFWAKIESNYVKFGATDYGQKALREVVFVELPSVGDKVNQNEAYGTVESVKAVVDLIAPVSGTVIEVNKTLQDTPDLINQDPYEKGWLISIAPSNLKEELKNILTFEDAVDFYKELNKG
jgi:glycine cleavage system H protein